MERAPTTTTPEGLPLQFAITAFAADRVTELGAPLEEPGLEHRPNKWHLVFGKSYALSFCFSPAQAKGSTGLSCGGVNQAGPASVM